jgi:adenosylcobinamide kinase / adenosylcobinamide-phosphate guanylyltransferase
MTDGTITLVIGGSRSGKSRFAEELVVKDERSVVYLATCRTDDLDSEMKTRIDTHRKSRPSHWITIENQFDLIQVARECAGKTLLMDCLTLWLSNELAECEDQEAILRRLEKGLDAMIQQDVNAVIVSNELGMGIVPIGKEVREYRDLVGRANQLVARKAQNVYWMVAGIPVGLKHNGKLCDLNTVDS